MPLAGLLVLIAMCAYGTYRLVHPRPARRAPMPIFETHVSHGTEAKVEALDLHIYKALLSLNVPAEAVLFKSVETKQDQGDEWTYSDMEIHFQDAVPEEPVKTAFFRELAHVIPEESYRFVLGPSHEIILEVSVNGHPTHRLAFIREPEKMPLPHPPPRRPQIAIIIDDLGYDEKVALSFLELDGVFTFSVLPNSPFQEQIASAVHHAGRDVLLHLPMEPLDYPNVNPGKGALIASMEPEELMDQLCKDLSAVPFVVGVNNHMGSKLTQDSTKMLQILAVLKGHGLFFIDSVTSPLSRCAEAARLLNLTFGRRNVFLDHVQEANAIRFQLKRLVTVAETQGKAIGIGHPYPITLEVLRQELPKINQRVELVPVSQIVG